MTSRQREEEAYPDAVPLDELHQQSIYERIRQPELQSPGQLNGEEGVYTARKWPVQRRYRCGWGFAKRWQRW